MNKLPSEILCDVCIPLHQQDKVEFMRVCKTWKNLIEYRYLYHTVRLCNEPAIEYLIKKFQEAPQLANQAEYLIVEHFPAHYDGMNKLPALLKLLPNLRYFYHQSWFGSYVKIQSLIQPWCERIEYLAIHGNRAITSSLVSYNHLSQIRRLYIPGKNVFDSAFFPKLLNLNTLTELTLDKCAVTLNFFNIDLLHKKLTLLESFIINQLRLEYDDPLPNDITPAPSLKKLHLSFIQSMDVMSCVVWLQYFGKKYPNLSDFKSTYINDKFSEMFNNTENTIDISQGYTSLFNGLGYQLKKLDLQSTSLPENLFEMLDNSGCELKYLRFSTFHDHLLLKHIRDSKQAESIQTLELNFTCISDLKWLKSLTRLRTLIMCLMKKDKSLQLNALIRSCPDSLESLELDKIRLTFGTKPSFHHLKSLKLTTCTLYEGIDTFLSKNLQQLHTLKLFHCMFHYDNHSMINLPGHSLSRFEMTDCKNRQFFTVLVITPTEKKKYRSRYRIRRIPVHLYDMPSLCPPTTCSKPGSVADYHFTLRCTSVANVVL